MLWRLLGVHNEFIRKNDTLFDISWMSLADAAPGAVETIWSQNHNAKFVWGTFLPRDASTERGYEIAFVRLSVRNV